MHAPDGFLNAAAAVSTGVVSAGAVSVALRQTRDRLKDAQIPLAGLAAAFVFAAQMFNFPVAAGTTGHLLGGALAAVLLGPWTGLIVVTVVVVVQALLFADGGLTALGYNVLNMAVVTSLGGWGVFRLSRRFLPVTVRGISLAAGLAAFVSVILSSAAFSLEWLFGATLPVPVDRVFVAMVGVHALIGIGEAVITTMTVGAVLRARPDLVVGADGLAAGARTGASQRRFVIGALATTFVVAGVISQLAFSSPDGLERVAEDTGIAAVAEDHALGSSLFADYAVRGVRNESLSLAVAGIAGSLLTLAVGGGLVAAARGQRRERPVPKH
jgi:cobalt/nickel transport system permease protein